MMDPLKKRLQPTQGNLPFELVDPLQKCADRVGVGLGQTLFHLGKQAATVRRQRQKRGPERRVFGIKDCFRVALPTVRDGGPDRVLFRLGHRRWRTQ